MPRDPLPELCRHCGAPLAAGPKDGPVDGYCCRGCAAAHALIEQSGLGAFYRRLELKAGERALKPEPHDAAALTLNVRGEKDGWALDLMVDGLHCAACVWLIETLLSRQPEVTAGRVNFSTRRLALRWRGERERGPALVALIESLGFRLTPFDPKKLSAATDRTARELIRCLAVAGFAAGNVMLLSVSVWAGHDGGMGTATRDLLHWLSALIALPALLYAGRPFFRSAAGALRRGRTNMDVPISLGITLTAAMSLSETVRHGPYAYFDSALTLVFFLLIGRVLDHLARGKAREAAAHLLSLGVTGATRLKPDGTAETIPASALAAGDAIVVAPGEKVPADGDVIAGGSDLDGSLLTGESLPAAAAPGARIYAGQVNLSAPLTVRVSAVGDSTLLAEIVRLMEAAEGGRAFYRQLADRLTRHYAPLVHVLAAATFVYWLVQAGSDWQVALLRAVSVLIITCPCALGLAIPAAQVVAGGRLFRRGILLKSPTALERLAEVDMVVFDKTGTLTLGQPVLRADPAPDPAMLSLAAGLARSSRHPLSRALAAACPVAPVIAGVQEIPGCGLAVDGIRLGSRRWLGMSEDGSTDAELWLRTAGGRSEHFRFEESLRRDAAATVSGLRRSGYGVALLSGDRPSAVRRVAQDCGIETWQALATPVSKVARLEFWRRAGLKTLMVGDGLNDAPALAAASVSLSPASAADIAQVTADVVFQGDSLGSVTELLATARQTRAVIRQNLVLALVYNLTAVPLAMAGLVTPPLAAALMSSSSVLVVLNALRLRRQPKET